LVILIPGLVISIMGIVSVSRQNRSRKLQMLQDWEAKLAKVAGELERETDRSIGEAIAAFAATHSDPAHPVPLQRSLKKLLERHPIVRFPFLITAERQFQFPFTRPVLAALPATAPPTFRSRKANALFRKGETLEYRARDWVGAIRAYLEGERSVNDPREKARFRFVIGRVYFKWGKYPQALTYTRAGIIDRDPFFHLQALQQIAMSYDRSGAVGDAAKTYLQLYEEILGLQSASHSDQLDYYKNEALDYLDRVVSRDSDLQKRLTAARRRDSIDPEADLDLRWQFFRMPQTDSPEAAGHGDQIESQRLREVQEFYLSNHEKRRFYSRIERQFIPLIAAPMGNRPVFTPIPRIGAVVSTLPVIGDKANPCFFGFQVSLRHIQQRVFLPIRDRYWREEWPRVDLVRGTPADFSGSRHLLLQLPLRGGLAGDILLVTTPDAEYLGKRIRREFQVNYTLIAAFIITLFAGIILVVRYLRRELELIDLKSRFLEAASHTLKTPLARIRLLSERLQLDWLSDESQRSLQAGKIVAETERMDRLIANMLDLSRIEAGQKQYRLRRGSLAEAVKREYDEIAPLLQELGFAHSIEVTGEIPDSTFDEGAIRMTVGNLLQNAIAYSSQEKDVRIELFCQGEEAVITVADRGMGIAPEKQAAIFQKFYRVEGEADRLSVGSGLGLFLARHAVEAHGGRITVAGQPGVGTTFTIRLPFAGGPGEKARKGSS